MRALAENLGNRTPDRDRLREETRARPRTPADLNLDARAIDFHWKDLRGTVFAGQALGIKEVEEGIWLVSFMEYDLGYIDLEEKTRRPLDNPFGPKV